MNFADLRQLDATIGHTPTVLNGAVADTAVGLMLAAARRFQEGRLKIENNEWKRGRLQWMLGQDVVGSTVGIVGLGGIGQTIVKRLKGFDVGRFLYTGHSLKAEGFFLLRVFEFLIECHYYIGQRLDAVFVSFDILLRESDFIFVTCPETEETAGMFDANAFAKMKPTSVFVNVASSDIVVQDALVEALRNGVVFAAGLDVMMPRALPFDHPLLQLPNCGNKFSFFIRNFEDSNDGLF